MNKPRGFMDGLSSEAMLSRLIPGSLSHKCLSALADGPATTSEVSAESGLSPRVASVTLSDLFNRGYVAREPLNSRVDSDGRVVTWLWSARAIKAASSASKTGYTVDPIKGVVYGPRGNPKLRTANNGYVTITSHGRYIGSAHRMVWECVNGSIPDGMEVNHINGIRDDNRISNLEIVTRSENVLHSYKFGLSCAKGERNNSCKLTESQVREIRNSVLCSKCLAKTYSVHTNTIVRIKSGKLWGHLK